MWYRAAIYNLILLGAFLLSHLASAQIHNFIRYSLNEGLPQSQVLSIIQDQKGYLWIGTSGGGVSRYDGRSFLNFTRQDGLAHDQVNDILQDKQGNVWFATDGGLTCYPTLSERSAKNWNGTAAGFVNTPLLEGKKVYQLVEDSKNRIWVASSGGAYVLDVAKFSVDRSVKPIRISDKDISIRAIYESSKVLMVMGGRNALWEVSLGGTVLHEQKLGDKDAIVQCIHENSSGLLVGTNRGVYQSALDGDRSLKAISGHRKYLSNSTRDIFTDRSGNTWFATVSGLVKLKDDKAERYTLKEGLPTKVINTILEDREGNLWFGTDGGGMVKFTEDVFVRYLMEKAEDVNVILSVIQDKNDQLWVGTNFGLYNIRNNKISSFLRSNPFKQFNITVVRETRDGSIWFGVKDYGVFRYHSDEFDIYDKQWGLSGNEIYAILETGAGEIWLGTEQGVAIIEPKGKGYQPGKQISEETKLGVVASLMEDKAGDIWIGTELGLFQYNPSSSTLKHLKDEPSLQNTGISSIAEDKFGQLWIGTNGGIIEFGEGKMNRFTTRNGLGSNLVQSIIGDTKGNLWIGTNRGVDRLDLNRYREKGEAVIVQYSREEGFTGVECNPNAIFQDRAGDLWFGTVKGLMKYDPERDIPNELAPLTHITSLRSGLDTLDWSAYSTGLDANTGLPVNLQLPYDLNHLTFDFVGISLTAPEKVRYRYMLEGVDADWVESGTRNSITYSSLAPRHNYRFLVMARNNSGKWNEVPVEFSFAVIPPFWMKTWFWIVSGLGILGIIFLVFYAIFNRKVKQKELDERISNLRMDALRAQMNPHFIFNALNSIQNFINKSDEESANLYLAKFASLMRLILDNAQKSNITIQEELNLLELYLELESLRFKQKFSYEIKVDEGLHPEFHMIPSMLIQPYVENAINHGLMHKEGDGHLLVELKLQGETLVCTVEDNGVGREKSAELRGRIGHKSAGTNITQDRLDILNSTQKGSMSVEIIDLKNGNNEAEGTRVVVNIPLKDA